MAGVASGRCDPVFWVEDQALGLWGHGGEGWGQSCSLLWVSGSAQHWFMPTPQKLGKWPCLEMGSLQSHEGKNGIGGVLGSSDWCPSQTQEETQRDREAI